MEEFAWTMIFWSSRIILFFYHVNALKPGEAGSAKKTSMAVRRFTASRESSVPMLLHRVLDTCAAHVRPVSFKSWRNAQTLMSVADRIQMIVSRVAPTHSEVMSALALWGMNLTQLTRHCV
jgi:hypothetical protein